MKLTIDLQTIDSEEKLNKLIGQTFRLEKIEPDYGYNYSAFLDIYPYLERADEIIIRNFDLIVDPKFKKRVEIFRDSVLPEITNINPKFKFKLI